MKTTPARRGLACAALLFLAAVGGCAGTNEPLTSLTARDEFLRYLKHMPPALTKDAEVHEIPLAKTPLKGTWAFAVEDPKYRPDAGMCRYRAIFLVVPAPPGARARAYVASAGDFADIFRMLFTYPPPAGKPPRSEAEAIDIAETYAWLLTQQHPDRMEVLDKEGARRRWGEALAAEITPLTVTTHKSWRAPDVADTAYAVEFCTHSPDLNGAIFFWHVDVAPRNFAVSWRIVRMFEATPPAAKK